jgi:hypothetical protein
MVCRGMAMSKARPTSRPRKSGGNTPIIVSDSKGSADHAGRALKPLLPQPIADDDDLTIRPASRHIVSRRKEPPDLCAHAERVKEIAAEELAIDRRGVSGKRERGRAATCGKCTHTFEQVTLPDLIDGRIAIRRPIRRGCRGRNEGQTLWRRDRQ